MCFITIANVHSEFYLDTINMFQTNNFRKILTDLLKHNGSLLVIRFPIFLLLNYINMPLHRLPGDLYSLGWLVQSNQKIATLLKLLHMYAALFGEYNQIKKFQMRNIK